MKDKFNSLNILKHKKQSGQSAALISGVKYAKSKSASKYCFDDEIFSDFTDLLEIDFHIFTDIKISFLTYMSKI